VPVQAREQGRNGRDGGRDMRRPRPQRSNPGKGRDGRFFSCLDLSLDVLAKTLLHIPHLVSWKIEGRKKGPHYVYHVVTAYRMLRDNPGDPQARKDAEAILEMALGRPGSRARFLPHKDNLIPTDPSGQTSSGLLAGKINVTPEGQVLLKPHFELLPQDYLRVGVEDERWHATLPVTRRTPKAGTLMLRLPKHKTPKAGTPVFLIDRREPELMQILREWQARLDCMPTRPSKAVESEPRLPRPVRPAPRPEMVVRASMPQGRETRGCRSQNTGLWLSPRTAEISRTIAPRICWWLPPVIWPEEEEAIRRRLPPDTSRDIYRIRLTGETAEPLTLPALEQALSGGFFQLELADGTRLRRDLWDRCGDDTLRGLFLRRLRQEYDAADPRRQKEIEQAVRFGLAAIDNKEL